MSLYVVHKKDICKHQPHLRCTCFKCGKSRCGGCYVNLTIMVTHDQEEAQTMADRIFVMKDGEIIQSGTPNEIYTKANSPFIASFIGSMNFIPAVISNSNQVKCNNVEINCDTGNFQENESVQIAIRPEDIQFN